MRRGMTLMEIVVTVVIVGVLGGAIYLNQAQASRLGTQSANVDITARTLEEIADATGRVTGTGGPTSFNQVIGQANAVVTANVSRLSQLTTPITNTQTNSCYYTFSTSEANRWITPFYYRVFPTTGFKFAPGFVAQDSMVRYNSPGVPTTIANRPSASDAFAYGTSAIVMPNTELSDALALLARVAGDQSGVTGAVRYFPQDGSNPVTLEYHFTIRGC